MQVQVNTGHDIKGSEKFDAEVHARVESALGRFDRLTRVEVHLRDDNAAKSHGDDKRCVIEARPAGMQPVVVEEVAGSVDAALDSALGKMTRLLSHTFDKQNHRHA